MSSVLHERSGPETRWSTVNMAEVMPGVLTPLAWTFWREPAERGLRGSFADAGVLSAREIEPPPDIDRRLTAVFHGRYAGNLTYICELCDQTPGSSGERFEEQMFGYADPDVVRGRSYRRYPIIAVKMPVNVALLPRRLAATRTRIDRWWRAATAADDGQGAAVSRPGAPEARLQAARGMLHDALRIHLFCSLVAQGCYDQVAALALAVGEPGLELELMTGYGGMEEARVAGDLWAVSRGTLALSGFLSRHGYHGPNEGQLSSRSWREDPAPVESLLDSYRRASDEESPAARELERAAARERATARVIGRLPAARRPGARVALAAAAAFLPRREIGKAAFLQAIDGGRAAAREIGGRLTRERVIDAVDDVFFLTIDELAAPPADARAAIQERKAQHAAFLASRLPERWTGEPAAIPAALDSAGERHVSGIPVSGGIVEGRARVILDPAHAGAFEPGDVLVCETTDPGWVVFFGLAAAVVIDVGGPLSHGAIVARELGIPAVINTRTGTQVIPDGAIVRVDGSAGRVELIDPHPIRESEPHAA